MGTRKFLSKLGGGLVAAILTLGIVTVQASAANVLIPMLLTFNDLPGTWAPDPQDCEPYIYQGLIRYDYGATDAVETCLDDSAENIVDETLGLYRTHAAAEAGWHEWVVNDEGEQGVNRVKVHVTFPVPVVFDESTFAGPSNAVWDVTAVKGRVLVYLNYAGGPQVDVVIGIFDKALNKVHAL